jgi:hypothetical protein
MSKTNIVLKMDEKVRMAFSIILVHSDAFSLPAYWLMVLV